MINNRYLKYLFHVLAYDVVWFVCLATAGSAYSFAGCIVAFVLIILQILWQIRAQQTSGLALMVVLFWITGMLGDGLLALFQWLNFAEEAYFNLPWPHWLPPLFMQLLWICFGVTFFSTLQFFTKHLWALSLGCFLGFPLAYYLGAILGAATLTHGYKSLLVIGLLYAVFLPACVLIYNRLRGSYV